MADTSNSSYTIANKTEKNTYKKIILHNFKFNEKSFRDQLKSFISKYEESNPGTTIDDPLHGYVKNGVVKVDYSVTTQINSNITNYGAFSDKFDFRHVLMDYFFKDRNNQGGNDATIEMGIGFDVDDFKNIGNRNPLYWLPMNEMGKGENSYSSGGVTRRESWTKENGNERMQLAKVNRCTSIKTYPEMYSKVYGDSGNDSSIFNKDWVRFFKVNESNEVEIIDWLKNVSQNYIEKGVCNPVSKIYTFLTDVDKRFGNKINNVGYITTETSLMNVDHYDTIPQKIHGVDWSVIEVDLNDVDIKFVDFVWEKRTYGGKDIIAICPHECLITKDIDNRTKRIYIPSYNYLVANPEGEHNLYPYNKKPYGTYYYYYDSTNKKYKPITSTSTLVNYTIFTEESVDTNFFRVGSEVHVGYKIFKNTKNSVVMKNPTILEIVNGISRTYGGVIQDVPDEFKYDINDSVKSLKSPLTSLWVDNVNGQKPVNENTYSILDNFDCPFNIIKSDWENKYSCGYSFYSPTFVHFYIDTDTEISFIYSKDRIPNLNLVIDNEKLYLGNYTIPPIGFFNSSENLININENVQKSIAILREKQINDKQDSFIEMNSRTKSASRENSVAEIYSADSHGNLDGFTGIIVELNLDSNSANDWNNYQYMKDYLKNVYGNPIWSVFINGVKVGMVESAPSFPFVVVKLLSTKLDTKINKNDTISIVGQF